MKSGRVGQSELLRCPFCGGKAELVDYAGYEVVCDCGASFCKLPSRRDCIAGWNTRAAAPTAELEREIRMMKDAHRTTER